MTILNLDRMVIKFKYKLLKKILALILALHLLLNPLAVTMAFAEEFAPVNDGIVQVSPTPSPDPVITSTPEPENTPALTASDLIAIPSPTVTVISNEPASTLEIKSVEEVLTPTPTSVSEILTGDTNSSANTETKINNNTDTIPGSLTSGSGDCNPPEGQTSCPDDITLNKNNQAELTVSGSSSSITGDNNSNGAGGNVLINTGEATASAFTENVVNLNQVILEPAQTFSNNNDAPLATETKTLTVKNNNEAEVANDIKSGASTGDNLASENLGDIKINTGDALAWANVINLLNTNIVGSNFELLLLDVLKSQGADINLNDLWMQMKGRTGTDQLQLAGDQGSPNLNLLIYNYNKAKLQNNVEVLASSGSNEANGNNNVGIDTGDATALANVTNLVNTNIISSDFFLGIINIFDPNTGNLILPRLENFLNSNGTSSGEPASFENQNNAQVNDKITSLSSTGNNQENNNGGGNNLTTGNSISAANDVTLANLNIQKNNWFILFVNKLGNWTGQVYGWTAPSSAETQGSVSKIYEFGMGDFNFTQSKEPLLTETEIKNKNDAIIENNISTEASTGNNEANNNRGETKINTGNAKSVTNVLNLANLNISGGKWFMGIVNIVPDWAGNIVFAYPDVTVSFSGLPDKVNPGDTFEFGVNYQNQGFDEAKDVNLAVELPKGLSFVGENSGFEHNFSGQVHFWKIGNLDSGKGSGFVIKVSVDENVLSGQNLTLLNSIVSPAYAAEDGKGLIINAYVKTSDPESNVNNNNDSQATYVYPRSVNNEQFSIGDQRQPVLEITEKNNVNDFIYDGDTITFEVKIKNISDVTSYNTRFEQKLYDGVPGELGTVVINLGTIEPGKGGMLTFGTKIADHGMLKNHQYHTLAKIIGNAPNGNEVSSNEVRTEFNLRITRTLSEIVKEVSAQGEVLGASDENNFPVAVDNTKGKGLTPYILLLLVSSLWVTEKVRLSLKKEEAKI